MPQRPPDSRVSAGQRIEDELDAITDTTRRDTANWIRRLMRAHPGNAATLAAVIGGIAGGILDQLHELGRGDAEQIRAAWQNFVESYLAAMAEDVAADAQDATPPEGQADA